MVVTRGVAEGVLPALLSSGRAATGATTQFPVAGRREPRSCRSSVLQYTGVGVSRIPSREYRTGKRAKSVSSRDVWSWGEGEGWAPRKGPAASLANGCSAEDTQQQLCAVFWAQQA